MDISMNREHRSIYCHVTSNLQAVPSRHCGDIHNFIHNRSCSELLLVIPDVLLIKFIASLCLILLFYSLFYSNKSRFY